MASALTTRISARQEHFLVSCSAPTGKQIGFTEKVCRHRLVSKLSLCASIMATQSDAWSTLANQYRQIKELARAQWSNCYLSTCVRLRSSLILTPQPSNPVATVSSYPQSSPHPAPHITPINSLLFSVHSIPLLKREFAGHPSVPLLRTIN